MKQQSGHRDGQPVTGEELRAEIRGVEERLTAKLEESEGRMRGLIEASAEETRRHLAVAVETISSEVRGAFGDATAVLKDQVTKHEARIAAVEKATGLQRR